MSQATDQNPFPHGNLSKNLIAFSEHLRRIQPDFNLGPQEVQDGLLALEAVDLGNAQEARQALKLVMCSNPEQERVFDDLFFQFFLPARRRRPSQTDPQKQVVDEGIEPGEQTSLSEHHARDNPLEGAEGESIRLPKPAEGDTEASGTLTFRALFSRVGTGSDTIEVTQEDLGAMRVAARAVLGAVRLGRSRRWDAASGGQRLHFRGTLRKGLQTGGEFIHTAWLAKARREPHFVFVLDGSRSMAGYAEQLLQFAFALRQCSARVEVFSFSTLLKRITRELEAHQPPAERPRLAGMAEAWGGGTRIGESLRRLGRDYGGLVRPDTVLIVASDGLDTGEPEVLEAAIRTLRRRSAALVWLNPLLALPGYDPHANCMKTVLPYLDRFCSASTPKEFATLADGLKLRR